MRRSFEAVRLGAAAAWSSARWIEGAGLLVLARGRDGDGPTDPDTERLAGTACRWAGRTLRLLARLPGDRWRATCLYRSVAACLVRRRLSLPHRLTLGVRADAERPEGVGAHAWEAAADEPSDAWSPFVRPGGR